MSPASAPGPLRSERLTLRLPSLDDYLNSFALWSDPNVTTFLGGRPHTKEEVWARLLRYVGHWHAIGYGYWVVETSAGEYVGELGLADYRRDIEPSFDGIPEIGWVLAAHFHGQGMAAEAARMALAWRDQTLPGSDTACIIAADHTRSIRLATKLGFVVAHHVTYHDRPTILLRRLGPHRDA